MAKTPVILRKAQQVNIQIDKGSTFRTVLTWKIGPVATAVPKDITGYTARMQIRADVDGTIILHELTTSNGGISVGGADGKVSLLILDTASTAFTWNDAVYDLELIDTPGTGDVRRLLYGDVEAFNEATK